jgi:hypothetical protein
MNSMGGVAWAADGSSAPGASGGATPNSSQAASSNNGWRIDFDQAEKIGLETKARYHGHQGLGDAMRHAEWNRRMALEVNQATATVVSYAYEARNVWETLVKVTQEPRSAGYQFSTLFKDLPMDLHNNAVGRRAASEGRRVTRAELTSINGGDDPWKNY